MPRSDQFNVCSQVLVRNVEVSTLTQRERLDWLYLVDERSYASARQQSAGLDAMADVFVSATYDDAFQEQRRTYLEMHQYHYEFDLAVATLKMYLKNEQLVAWSSCIRTMRTTAFGLMLWFDDESAEGVTMFVAWRPQPRGPRTGSFVVTVDGAEGRTEYAFELDANGERNFPLRRSTPQSTIRATVNGAGLADSDLSLPPLPPPPPRQPRLLTPDTRASYSAVWAEFPGSLPSGYWNSGAFAPQSASFAFPAGTKTVTRIFFAVAQAPSGETDHRLEINGREVHRFFGNTHNGQELYFSPPEPIRNVNSITIRTVTSPSWVAWNGVYIFGFDE